ncbi:hypothetical protein [Alkalihalophilus marmarensis]|uniref:hypothetical protein n=1 Tax=Alkalihalophilus marmarensis TaxID=521377 RepID=UPI002E2270EA|nr:hypothetical protein [Alkalihalophilus marmarensis]
MNDLELLRILLVNSKNVRDEATYRAYTYGIINTLLLSSEVFKNNIDIQEFLVDNNIEFRPYVYQSRTQIIGRITRVIEEFDLSQLKKINSSVNKIAFSNEEYSAKKVNQNNDNNYFDSLLNQFERKKS